MPLSIKNKPIYETLIEKNRKLFSLDNTDEGNRYKLPAVFVGVVTGFVFVVLCLFITTKLRSRRRRPRRSESDEAPKTSVSDNGEI